MWRTEMAVLIQNIVRNPERDPEIFFTSMTSMWFIFEPRSVIQSHFRKESLSVSVMEDEHAIVLLLHSVCWGVCSTAYFC